VRPVYLADVDLENHGTRWSDAEKEKLRELYPETASTQLVEEFGRTSEAIKTKAKQLDIQKNDGWKDGQMGPSDEAIRRGLAAEQQFEEFVQENGWECYRNGVFRNLREKDEYEELYNIKKESYEQIISDPDADWANEERLRTELEEMRQNIDEKSAWLFDFRAKVNDILTESERSITAYPDYVVGDRPGGPIFVEVKYGSSSLDKNQVQFFGLLRDRGFDVYIFRVMPTGDIDFSEWDGGWK